MTEEVHYERFRKQMLEKGVVPPAIAMAAVGVAPSLASASVPTDRSAEEELSRRHEQMKRDLEEQAR